MSPRCCYGKYCLAPRMGFAPDLESCGRYATAFLHHVCQTEYAQLVPDLGEAHEPTEDVAVRKLCSECLEPKLGIKESGLVMPTATARATMAPRVEPAPPATSAPTAVDSQTLLATGAQQPPPPVEPGEEAEERRDGRRPSGTAAPADSGMVAEDIDPPPPATKRPRGRPRGSKNKQAPTWVLEFRVWFLGVFTMF
eukprot:jgi/Tetstr1/438618/TSEL_027169.t1